MDQDIIIGLHSIVESLKNKKRRHIRLISTEDSFNELKKALGYTSTRDFPTALDIQKVKKKDFQNVVKKIFEDRGLNFKRVPSDLMLETSHKEFFDFPTVLKNVESGEWKKIVALDQVTDVHNAAACMRTAAFFGVDCLIISQKGFKDLSPSMYRLASGALEHLEILQTASLPKTLSKLKEREVVIVGMSEHASEKLSEISLDKKTYCLVLGAEDKGLSHAVTRIVDKNLSLGAIGEIKSLNVSVAAAVAMEKLFGPC